MGRFNRTGVICRQRVLPGARAGLTIRDGRPSRDTFGRPRTSGLHSRAQGHVLDHRRPIGRQDRKASRAVVSGGRYSESVGEAMAIKNTLSVELNGQSIAIELHDPGPVRTVRLEAPEKRTYPLVGHCIYCGSEDALSDEHIVPYGLSGEDVIRKASCGTCAKETGRFEQLVLRGPMRAARIHRRLKSRTKYKEGSNTHRLAMTNDSGEFEIDLPLSEYPILLHFPIFTQPGHLTGWDSPGIRMEGIHTIHFGPDPQDVAVKHGARELRFPSTTEQPTAFARMLAKIAYGYAFAHGALSRIDGPSPVLACIRGLADDVGQWVFTSSGETVAYPGFLHRFAIHEWNNLLVAEVHLFSDSQTPRYGVILGKLNRG